jgi:hypothetical protein
MKKVSQEEKSRTFIAIRRESSNTSSRESKREKAIKNTRWMGKGDRYMEGLIGQARQGNRTSKGGYCKKAPKEAIEGGNKQQVALTWAGSQ